MSSSTSRDILDFRTPLLKDDVEEEILEAGSFDDDLDDSETRKETERVLLRKLDKRMSILVLLYILNFIDRNNAGAARLHGFEADLHLEGQQFATVISVLYVGYISMQVPSNMFLNHIGKPSIYLPTCMALWGFVSLMTGFATNFYGVLITRFLLGVLEASFFPGALFLLSKWYKHNELGLRTTIFFCGGIISNALGALMASAILDNMEGVFGRAAWRWLFYIEGSMTIVVALCAILVLPDFPETSRPDWLTEKELRLAMERMHANNDHASSETTSGAAMMKSGFWMAMKDINVFLLTLASACQIVSVSFTVYFPTLTDTFGYGPKVSLLLCAPPYLFATALAFFISRHSDETGERFGHIAGPYCIGTIGCIIPLFTMNIPLRYLSLFLMTQSYAGVGVLLAWCSNVFPTPPAKRAVALAFINSVSQIAAIFGSYVWPTSWGPTYRASYAICAIAAMNTIAGCYMLRRRLAALNRKIDREESERGALEIGFRYLL